MLPWHQTRTDAAYVERDVGNQHQPAPDAGIPVGAEGVERVVLDVVGERRGIHVAAPSELRVGGAPQPDEGLEERHPLVIVAHHVEEARVRIVGDDAVFLRPEYAGASVRGQDQRSSELLPRYLLRVLFRTFGALHVLGVDYGRGTCR